MNWWASLIACRSRSAALPVRTGRVRFRGLARYGKDHADRQTFYGFRLHLRLGWPGVITHAFLAPANETDGELAPIVLEGTQGLALGDRAYWVPDMQASLHPRDHLASPLPQRPRADGLGVSEFGARTGPLSH